MPLALEPEGGEVSSGGGLARQFARVFVENKLAVVGAGFIVFAVALLLRRAAVYHDQPGERPERAALLDPERASGQRTTCSAPTAAGFDILGRIMYGGQVSLEVGFAAAGLGDGDRGPRTARSRASSAAGSTR